MKKILFIASIFFFGLKADAQFTKATLQASGLTCSMCSKAVKEALEEVTFVEKIQVNIKTQEYNIAFKNGADVNFDALKKAVEDAGFSVASFKVTADLPTTTIEKDKHLKVGKHYLHFLNAKDQKIGGTTTFAIVDKQFVPAREFKKWSSATKMPCVQTGKMAQCCTKEDAANQARVYHIII